MLSKSALSSIFRTFVVGAALAATPAISSAGIFLSIGIAPPALPIYTQPLCPGDGYIWTPGYWAYGDQGYFWVPGTWVVAPFVGGLWTPGYWGWGNGLYLWHAGYWGTHIGFYGGVNYGFGYGGFGYQGGYWNHGIFNYNRSVNNVNVTNIHNVYNRTVINNGSANRVSFNGGSGGVQARASAAELSAANERHVAATSMQVQHQNAAFGNRALLASVNHGSPAIAATQRPGAFNSGVVRASAAGAPFNASAYRTPGAQNNVRGPNGATFGRTAPAAAAQARNTPAPQNQNGGTRFGSSRPAPQMAARPQANVARPQQQSPQQAYRPQPASRPQQAPRPQTQARPQSSPHPQSAPRSQPSHSNPSQHR